jgi:hypothetical protein
MLSKKDEIKEAASKSFLTFVKLIHPNRILGSIHSELMSWMTREEASTHQLILLPRGHQKSTIAGSYYVAWLITRNPAITILYISSASNLAVKQLKYIKDILTSSRYKYYWPDMVNEDEGKREKWTESEISVDHPKRKENLVRDPTVFTAGLTTSIVGLHADFIIMDDAVTQQNAWTEEGRRKTEQQYSFLASIKNPGGSILIVGTRYHPEDLYGKCMDKRLQTFDEKGNIIKENSLYEVFKREVEDRGDGTGQFLWPRQQRLEDGEWFGFNQNLLNIIKLEYTDPSVFRAQYYNDPNDIENAPIQKECFQYYDKSFLTNTNGQWYYKNNKLNVTAAIDFAYSTSKTADYSSIVVVGLDAYGNYYVLDIDRFKSDKMSDYFQRLLKLHQKWEFRKVRAEVSVAQQVIVTDLKQNYIRPNGLNLTIEDFRPTRNQGTKEERMQAILQPRYNNRQIWHYQGGLCQILEEELVQSKPPHDDIKDCLSSCVDFALAPTASRRIHQPMIYNTTRFGATA